MLGEPAQSRVNSLIPFYRIFFFSDDVAAHRRFIGEYRQSAKLPFHEAKSQWETLEDEISSGPEGVVTKLLLPAVSVCAARAAAGDANRRVARLAIAALKYRQIIPDEPDQMRGLLTVLQDRADVDAILLTGGTGISSRDQTFETVTSLMDKPLPGYGELFRMLSYEQIGAAAMLSRAAGGLIGRTVVLTMPGSSAAVRLAMEKLILPELGHLVREARR